MPVFRFRKPIRRGELNHPIGFSRLGEKKVSDEPNKKMDLSVGRLETVRRKRMESIRNVGLGTSLVATATIGGIGYLSNGQPLRIGIMAGLAGAFQAALGAGGAHLANNRKVREATKNVGKELGERIQKTDELGNDLYGFLKKFTYVYINKKGEIVGTNRPRILVGRMRLESRKIIAEKY